MTSPIDLRESDGGRACVLPVRAQPGARRAGVAGIWNGRLKLAVTAPPEDGRANARLGQLLAELFGLRASEVVLVSGERTRNKQFKLAADAARIRARLAELLEGEEH
jgi:uncharacterized protein (TIGR00251 family)